MKRSEKCDILADQDIECYGNAGKVIGVSKLKSDYIYYSQSVEQDIDNYILDEFDNKNSKSKPVVMLATFLMLAAVFGIIIVFRIVFNNDYRKPVDEFFTAMNNQDYSKMSQTLFPGIDEYLGITEHISEEYDAEEAESNLTSHVTYRVDDTDKLNSSELESLNEKLVTIVGAEADEAYLLELEIQTTYTGEKSGTSETDKSQKKAIIGSYDGSWYIISLDDIIDI